MHVRRLGPEDVELALIAVRTVKQPQAHPTFSLEYLKKFLAQPDNVLIVAQQDGVPVGLLLGYLLDRLDRDQKMMCLYEIEVCASHRRCGVARAMIETLKRLGSQEPTMKTWLVSNRSNVAAVSLFEGTGATAAGRGDEVVYVYHGEP